MRVYILCHERYDDTGHTTKNLGVYSSIVDALEAERLHVDRFVASFFDSEDDIEEIKSTIITNQTFASLSYDKGDGEAYWWIESFNVHD